MIQEESKEESVHFNKQHEECLETFNEQIQKTKSK